MLQVTRSGFYAWKKRPASEHEARRDALASEIRSINSEQYLDVYGSPRMHQKLLKRGFEVCENTVAAVMKQEGITASTEKKFRVTTTDSNHSQSVAENIMDRDFAAKKRGEKLVSNLTYVATDEVFLFLVCVINLCTRRVVGWSIKLNTQRRCKLVRAFSSGSKFSIIAPLRRVGISAGRCTASVVRVFGKSFLKLRRLRQLRHLETSGKLRLTSTCRHSAKNKPNAQRARHGTPSPPSREDYSTAKDEFAGRPSKSSLMTIHAAENPSAARKTQETGPA